MKTFKKIGMLLMSIFLLVNFTSCNKEDDDAPIEGGSSVPKNTIRYQTIDGIIVRFENEDVFGGAKLISNKYSTTDGYGTMVFESEVTAIEKDAFYNKSTLLNIILPNSVVTIEHRAFENCTNLTSITIPNSVTSIGSNAFSGCSRLTNITIPNSVTSIGSSAFNNTKWWNNQLDGLIYLDCYLLGYKGVVPSGDIEIKEGTKFIQSYTFNGCTNLTNITIPNSVTSIGSSAFRGCSRLTNISIPNSVTSIGSSAFSGCLGLTNITIPSSVTSIRDYTFDGCTNLTSITIPNSVTSIGDYAFRDCSNLSDITIGNAIKSIGRCAFYECYNLKSITIAATTPPYVGSHDFTTTDFSTIVVKVPRGSLLAYNDANFWKSFRNIEEFDATDI